MNKKYLSLAVAGFLVVSTPSFANNSEKINLVKKAYISLDDGIYSIGKYADSDFKRALSLAYDYPTGSSCLDNDPMIDAQDYDKPKFSYSVDNKGFVVVKIKDPTMYKYTREVKYKLSGSPGNYKISDIYNRGSSFKQYLLKSCR